MDGCRIWEQGHHGRPEQEPLLWRGLGAEADWTEIGVGTTGFGIFFILFGILLYFDSVLLAFGNLLFLTGLLLIIGLRKTFSFFFQRHKLKGTSFFLGGVVIVLLRWPLLGMFLETYGFLSLFKALLHANLSVSKPFERWCTCSKPDLATVCLTRVGKPRAKGGSTRGHHAEAPGKTPMSTAASSYPCGGPGNLKQAAPTQSREEKTVTMIQTLLFLKNLSNGRERIPSRLRAFSAQSPTWGSNSPTVRSRPTPDA
ncbi:vesicle transport protein GOT1A isoform X2 [Prionailurus viverrinus]|uniref:vesicle transport protein GOT1A isoform X2 n=1 Tax=Prionailurus viverrinus TaxID=61388 RepID=UPI001FF1C2F6|nr:vesicle transport protein GOT1A isoform X2 [Prionailurus viverrinus]